MAYILDDRDITTLKLQNDAAIAAARADSETSDDDLAHLYALRGKLNRIAAGREDDDPKTAKRGTGKRAARSKANGPAAEPASPDF